MVQTRVLDRWPDGSARWVLVDTQVDVHATSGDRYYLDTDGARSRATEPAALVVTASDKGVAVDASVARFRLASGGLSLFDDVEVGGSSVLDRSQSGLMVTGPDGSRRAAAITSVEVEDSGSLRTVVRLTGTARAGGSAQELDITARIHFFAGLPVTRLLVTLTNPNRARHRGGFWDLGDPGSILIKDVAIALTLAGSPPTTVRASAEPGAPWTSFDAPFELYQDSSGGEHWQSANHVNRNRRVPNSFQGYRLRSGHVDHVGLRATPVVEIEGGGLRMAATMPQFWQNFPKAIEVNGSSLVVRLFPGQYSDLHELQGGEQKTHECFLSFGADPVSQGPLEWCRGRTIVGVDPEWSLSSNAVPFLAPLEPGHQALVQPAVEGPDRFELKREKIDEYGWRHFGEIYGDHESVRQTTAVPLISHYNNQYDPIAGFAHQWLRTADIGWWTLFTELAAHVADIDVYHTVRDRWAYNHGMFWHTYHYGDADTATHRTYPRAGRGRIHGGGPSADHNYTTGLMLHYFLTGDEGSRRTAIDLAQFVIDMDDGRKSPLGWLDAGDTGRATLSAGYYGPGRGPANSLNALLDAHRLTGDARFIRKAEQILRRVVHPREDIGRHRLDDPERRWFYTMFLQSLGKYLDDKVERGELDGMYAYGRESLLHYARWMATHEYPYLEKPEKLEFPTETWSAQDIRKSDVFYFAALHASGDERDRFVERGRFFHRTALASLSRAATRTLARPIVVLLTSGFVHPWFERGPGTAAPAPATGATFGPPEQFVPQRTRAVRRLAWIAAAVAVSGLLGLFLTA